MSPSPRATETMHCWLWSTGSSSFYASRIRWAFTPRAWTVASMTRTAAGRAEVVVGPMARARPSILRAVREQRVRLSISRCDQTRWRDDDPHRAVRVASGRPSYGRLYCDHGFGLPDVI